MKEDTLKRIALIFGVLGVILLYLISSDLSVDEISIERITKDNIGERVKIKGSVSNLYGTNTTTFIEISQPASLTVVIFDNISIEQGDYIEVIGEIEEYNEDIEIIGKRVRVIG